MRIHLSAIILGLCGPLLLSCGKPSPPPIQAHFTKADSLTDHYLSMYDSIHQVWNVMINDDNQKLNAMHHLIHELSISRPDKAEELKSLEERLSQLMRIRYTQKSMSNADVVNEYDLASRELTDELLTNVEAMKEFSYNKTLQALVRDIRAAESRIHLHRLEYDSVVKGYNHFIETHKEDLHQTDETLVLEKKPVFKAVTE